MQTEDSSLGSVVERKRIEGLPLNGRHVFNLVKIVGGVTPRDRSTGGFAEISNQSFSQSRINGGPAHGNQFFLDGVSNSAAVRNEINVVPMVDSVEEFRVEINALKAEFSQTAGGVINGVTKSGTNQFHCSAYEFLRDDAFDARNAFSTQPDPRTGRLKQVLRYNQYGGTVGGPVFIPKLYNGKNRTFFFAGYEQGKWRSTGAPRMESFTFLGFQHILCGKQPGAIRRQADHRRRPKTEETALTEAGTPPAVARTDCADGTMAAERAAGALSIPCDCREHTGAETVSDTGGAALVRRAVPAQPEAAQPGQAVEGLRTLAAYSGCRPSVSGQPFRRQPPSGTSKVRTVCGNTASTGLCGGSA